jgi:hypothetical protein
MQENYIVRNHSLRPNVCILLTAFIIRSGRRASLEEAFVPAEHRELESALRHDSETEEAGYSDPADRYQRKR